MSRRIVVKVGGAILDDAGARSRFAAAVAAAREAARRWSSSTAAAHR